MNIYFNDIASCVLKIVIALISVMFTVVIIPWLKSSAIPWLKEKQVYGTCSKFVRAAEKLAESGAIEKTDKNTYVIDMLRKVGIEITPEVRAFIESAVCELDNVVRGNLHVIAEQFVPDLDDEEDDDEYDEDFGDLDLPFDEDDSEVKATEEVAAE